MDTGERCDDLLDHAVHEVRLLGIAAQVLKRQHRDRRLVGQSERRSGSCGRDGTSRPYPIDAHRAGDVFEALLAEIRERGLYLALHLAEGVFRDADAARFSEPFEPRGDVDAVAEDVALLDDDVTEIDTNAKFDAALWRYGGVAGHHLPLHLDRTAH